MKKFSFSDVACVVFFVVVLAASVYMVVESGNPDLPIWLQRLMRWGGLFCLATYSYAAGSAVEDIKWEREDE